MDAFSVIDRPFKVVRVTSKGYLISTSVVDDISDPTSVQSEQLDQNWASVQSDQSEYDDFSTVRRAMTSILNRPIKSGTKLT